MDDVRKAVFDLARRMELRADRGVRLGSKSTVLCVKALRLSARAPLHEDVAAIVARAAKSDPYSYRVVGATNEIMQLFGWGLNRRT